MKVYSKVSNYIDATRRDVSIFIFFLPDLDELGFHYVLDSFRKFKIAKIDHKSYKDKLIQG